MSARSKRVALTIPEPTHRILRREAKRLGVPVTQIIMAYVYDGLPPLDREAVKR